MAGAVANLLEASRWKMSAGRAWVQSWPKARTGSFAVRHRGLDCAGFWGSLQRVSGPCWQKSMHAPIGFRSKSSGSQPQMKELRVGQLRMKGRSQDIVLAHQHGKSIPTRQHIHSAATSVSRGAQMKTISSGPREGKISSVTI